VANFRQLHTRAWSDAWFSDLPVDLKLLFIYLFSNERASVCGLYELPLKIIAFETGLDKSRIIQGLNDFEADDKVFYDFDHSVIWVRNMRKYQGSSSVKLQARIYADIKAVPDCELKQEFLEHFNGQAARVSIPYQDGIDTGPDRVSISVKSLSDSQSDSIIQNTKKTEDSLVVWFEELTGFPIPPSPENLRALDEMAALGAIRSDLEGATAFFARIGKVCRTPAQILESVRFQVGKRTQAKARPSSRRNGGTGPPAKAITPQEAEATRQLVAAARAKQAVEIGAGNG